MSRSLRIAYLGPAPTALGGGHGLAGQLLAALLDLGNEVDCYVARHEDWIPDALRSKPGFRVIAGRSRFRYGAWYSRTELTKLVSAQSTQALIEYRLAGEIRNAHAADPYDVLLQLSHVEAFGLRGEGLPPVVLYPSTHAGGELHWFLREADIARRCEPLARRVAVRALLSARAAAQRRFATVPAGFVCPSDAFRAWLCRDYGVDPERTRVVPYPVAVDVFKPNGGGTVGGRARVVFVSRMAVRKGVQDVVELSRRLGGLGDSISLELVGGRSQWSDYTRLLDGLDRRVATYRGGIPAESMPSFLAGADVLIQPSRYEPFSLAVGEALACGVPVVVSGEVGAAEDVSSEVARVVPAGDVDALEGSVRRLVAEMQGPDRGRLRALARAEAERRFHPRRVAESLTEALEELAR